MPALKTDGKSRKYNVSSNNGVHVKSSGLTGTVTFIQYDGTGPSMGNLKDSAGTDISYTADFDILLDLRSGDIFEVSQSGGTPETTIVTVGGAN